MWIYVLTAHEYRVALSFHFIWSGVLKKYFSVLDFNELFYILQMWRDFILVLLLHHTNSFEILYVCTCTGS